MKEIYEANPFGWIVLWAIPIGWMNHGKWCKTSTPSFSEENYYKLVHIKHKQVLEAYLADNSVDIEVIGTNVNSVWIRINNFVENYSPDLDYRLEGKEDETINSLAERDRLFCKEQTDD